MGDFQTWIFNSCLRSFIVHLLKVRLAELIADVYYFGVSGFRTILSRVRPFIFQTVSYVKVLSRMFEEYQYTAALQTQ